MFDPATLRLLLQSVMQEDWPLVARIYRKLERSVEDAGDRERLRALTRGIRQGGDKTAALINRFLMHNR